MKVNELRQIISQSESIEIPANQLATGIYFVHLTTADSKQLIKFMNRNMEKREAVMVFRFFVV
jgi:hypothetical protein